MAERSGVLSWVDAPLNFLIIGIGLLVSRWLFRWTDRIGWGRHGEPWVNRLCFWMFLVSLGLFNFGQVWFKGDNILLVIFESWIYYFFASVVLFIFGLLKGSRGRVRGWHLVILVGVVAVIFTLLLSGVLKGIITIAFWWGVGILFAWGALKGLNDNSPPPSSGGGGSSGRGQEMEQTRYGPQPRRRGGIF